MNILVPWIHWKSSDPCVQLMAKETWSWENIIEPFLSVGNRWLYGSIWWHLRWLDTFTQNHAHCEDINLLTGHSLWWLASIIFASNNSVRWLLLINPQMGWKHDFSIWKQHYRKSMHTWKRSWYQLRKDQLWGEYHLPWNHYWKESFQYDALELAKNIKSKVVVITWRNDPYIRIPLVEKFIDACSDAKLIVIDCSHVPKSKYELTSLGKALSDAKKYLA